METWWQMPECNKHQRLLALESHHALIYLHYMLSGECLQSLKDSSRKFMNQYYSKDQLLIKVNMRLFTLLLQFHFFYCE